MLVGPAFQLLDKANTIRNHIPLILFLDSKQRERSEAV